MTISLPRNTLASEAAVDLATALLGSPEPDRPGPRLLGIDGRSGTGKTTLADAVMGELSVVGIRASCLHMDELYAGWQGLAGALPALRRQVLTPLLRGSPASYRRWDWARGGYARSLVSLPPVEVVVIEGVGAVHADPTAYDLTVWLRAPTPIRRQRALARDGAVFAGHWDTWAAQEDELFGGGCGDPPSWATGAVLRLASSGPGS